MAVTRRVMLGLAGAVGAAGLGALTGCAPGSARAVGASRPGGAAPTTTGRLSSPPVSILGHPLGAPVGDGSTSVRGTQPHQPVPTRLEPGQTPPQFVVISWDGAAETSAGQLTRFREVANRTGASMTLFLSGLYLVPEDKRQDYQPPAGRPRGSSDIGFLGPASVRATIQGIGEAWVEGHEIGTHFNGHFCGAHGGASWKPADWRHEIEEARRFVSTWRTITGFTDLPPLPFEFDGECIGSRTPCLEGREGLLPVARDLSWRYDSSGTATQVWPRQDSYGLWDLSMPSIPYGPKKREVLAMDYNFMVQQSGGSPHGDPTKRDLWRQQAFDSLVAGFERAYRSNRAPMVVGNHFETWNGGIYMDAMEQFMDHLAGRPDVRMVSFRQLCDWLAVQDRPVLDKLRTLPVGQAPRDGWGTFLA